MNGKRLIWIGIVAVALVYGLNMSHAIDNYGILKNTLSLSVLAQSSSSEDGGTSTGEGDGSSSKRPAPDGYNQDCWEKPNNHNGENLYLYCNKSGEAKDCTLYLHSKFDASLGGLVFKKFPSLSVEVGWYYESKTSTGKKGDCEKTAAVGCTVYSCRETP